MPGEWVSNILLTSCYSESGRNGERWRRTGGTRYLWEQFSEESKRKEYKELHCVRKVAGKLKKNLERIAIVYVSPLGYLKNQNKKLTILKWFLADKLYVSIDISEPRPTIW